MPCKKIRNRHTAVTCFVLAALLCLPACGGTARAEKTGVQIDEAHFPETVLREAVSEYDLDQDGILREEEAEKVVSLRMNAAGISSLRGIEYLPALQELYCGLNHLTELDVSRNTRLQVLDCSRNQLKELDLSNNTALRSLECDNVELKGISMLTGLEVLSIPYCRVDKLDLSLYPNLSELECAGCGLTELDTSSNSRLYTLGCSDNRLTELDLEQNHDIHFLACSGNQLAKLDIRPCNVLIQMVRENECATSPREIIWTKLKPQDTDYIVVEAYLYIDPDTELITGF